MSSLTTKAFWAAAGERAVRTFAQSLVAVGLTGATGILDVDWAAALSASGLASLLSILTSVGASGVGSTDGPSFGTEVPSADAELACPSES